MILSPAQSQANQFGDDAISWHYLLKQVPQSPRRILLMSARDYSLVLSALIQKYSKVIDVYFDNQMTQSEKEYVKSKYENRINIIDEPEEIYYDLIVMNPPFTEGSGNGKKQLVHKFLAKAYDLCAQDGHVISLMPSSSLNYGYKTNKAVATLFSIRKFIMLANNAGFTDVHTPIYALLGQKTAERSGLADLYLDDQMMFMVKQDQTIYPINPGAWQSNVLEALKILYKVFDTNNDINLVKKSEVGIPIYAAFGSKVKNSLFGQNPSLDYKGYRLIVLDAEKAAEHGANCFKVKGSDAGHLSWYVSESKVMRFISALMRHTNTVHAASRLCISKDWEMLRSDQDIYDYYGFDQEQINFIEECIK